MDNISFCKSFSFRLLQKKYSSHTDNSAGISCHFIARMRKGSARFVTLSGNVMNFECGDIFYLPIGLRYHSYWTPDVYEKAVEWESYGFRNFPLLSSAQYEIQQLHPDDEAVGYLDGLYRNCSVSPESVGLLYLFLGKVLPSMQETDQNPKANLLLKAEQYIREHPDFHVKEVAQFCGISESGLYALFRNHANITPIDMKNKLLTEQAVQLLSSTDLSVEEISDQLHFCSSAYFRKIIKEQTGKTPTELRRELSLSERL